MKEQFVAKELAADAITELNACIGELQEIMSFVEKEEVK
jgi:hypothetical protein